MAYLNPNDTAKSLSQFGYGFFYVIVVREHSAAAAFFGVYPRYMVGDEPGTAPVYTNVYEDVTGSLIAPDGSGERVLYVEYWNFYPYDRSEAVIFGFIPTPGNLDISGHRSKGLDEVSVECADIVVTLCAEEACPTTPPSVERMSWAMADPADGSQTDAEQFEAFRKTRGEIEDRVARLWQRIGQSVER